MPPSNAERGLCADDCVTPAVGLVRSAFSTVPLPAHERFDQWRAQHDTLHISVRNMSDANAFAAARVVLAANGGQVVGRSRYTANEVKFGREGRDIVMLSLTTSGAVTVNSGSASAVVRSGGLVILDADTRTSTSVGTAGHEHVYLALPRAKAVEALRSDVLPRGNALRDIQHTPLAPFIAAQLRTLKGAIDDIPDDAAMVVLSSLEDMALAALRQAATFDGAHPSRADRLCYEAATHYIRREFADPDLTAIKLAAALGCSRTHLYGVFSLFGDTVAGALRTVRLAQARRLLEVNRQPISEIARAVGYRNESAFIRAFRVAQHTTPKSYRMKWLAGFRR